MRLSRRNTRAAHADPAILEALKQQAAAFHGVRHSTRQRYPDEIRALVFAAIDAGHPIIDVSAVCGVDRSAIAKWLREERGDARTKTSAERPAVRELRVVRERTMEPPTASAAAMGAGGAIATVRIGRRVTIDLPVSAITEAWLKMLTATDGGQQ